MSERRNGRTMVGEEEPHEYTATLGVFSETLSLAELTAALGTPSSGHDRGDPVSSRNAEGPKRKNARWSRESEGQRQRRLEDQIEDLVLFMEMHQDAFQALAPVVWRDIWCGVFSGEDAQGGFNLEPDLLRRLADLHLPMIFDLY
jgi:hypothetical protein